jgi:iron complex transport system substrate-binding protein
LRAAVAQRPRPRVLLLFEKKPISAAGAGSFPDEMLALAGGTNVLEGGAAYATVSLEKVLALDPDVILDAEMGSAAVPFDETWKGVRAVREGRVIRLADETVLRPGPRVLDGAAAIARALHPGI